MARQSEVMAYKEYIEAVRKITGSPGLIWSTQVRG